MHLERVVDFEADFVDGGSVNCCCILPTGHLVTGGDDASIRVWDFDIGDNGWRVIVSLCLFPCRRTAWFILSFFIFNRRIKRLNYEATVVLSCHLDSIQLIVW